MKKIQNILVILIGLGFAVSFVYGAGQLIVALAIGYDSASIALRNLSLGNKIWFTLFTGIFIAIASLGCTFVYKFVRDLTK